MKLTNFKFEVDGDGVALATFDMPDRTMNVISASVLEDLVAIADEVAGDDKIKGLVITSAKKDFCAGADLKTLFEGRRAELEKMEEEERLKTLFDAAFTMNRTMRKLETCGKSVAAAWSGVALGGGYEITLACHHRIMAEDAPTSAGLPEVLVGLFPGSGGTQRLPRLVGAMEALTFMTQGRNLDAATAVQKGFAHALAPKAELVKRAKEWVKANPGAKQPWDMDGFKLPGGGPYHPAGMQIFAGASPMLRKNTWGVYPAPKLMLQAIYEGVQVPFDAAIRIESRYFAKLVMMPESANMIRSIFNSKQELDKGGRRPAGQTGEDVKKIGVIGAGFMGAGVANVSAKVGVEVVLIDRTQEDADRGKQHVVDDIEKRVAKGRMSREDADAYLARITPTTDYSKLADVDLVVEAVFEDRDVKAKVFAEIEKHLPKDAMLGSNTSTLPITGLAESTTDPARFIGVHFFSPVEKMMLVELIVGEKTSDKAISRAIDFVGKIKKTPIVVKDTRGFYANRCVMRYVEQGMAMLSEGYKPALIENGARMAGMPVGPLSLQDEVAIDLGYKILKATKKDLGDAYVAGPTDPILTGMVEKHERFGRKNRKGFYDYPEGGKKRLWPGLEQFAVNGLKDPQPTWTEVRDRILYAQAIEAARTMEEGIVEDPREADVGSILGWGFAPQTGGALSFIDTIGAKKFVARADELAKNFGDAFKVPELLRDMAKSDDTFYARFGAKELVAAE